MIDQVRPGGIIAAITSKGTMDKWNNSAREYFARRADLVRAFRFPNTAHKNANTSVTTDLLIFKKLDEPREDNEPLPSWVNATTFQGNKDISVNQYFLEHPEDVIGTLEKTSSAHGFDLTCKTDKNRPLEETLKSLTDTLEKIYEPAKDMPLPKQVDFAENIQPLSFFIGNSEIFTERTISNHQTPTHADTSIEALAISMQEKGEISIDFMSSLTNKTPEEIISELEFDKIFYDFKTQEFQLAEDFLSGDIKQKIDDLQQIIEKQNLDFEANVSANVLNLQGYLPYPVEYFPKNDIEKNIVNANPDHNSWFNLSRNPEFESYILEHQDDFQFMVQVAKVQGSSELVYGDDKVSKLLFQRPLAILEAVRSDSEVSPPKYIADHFRAIGESLLLYRPDDYSWEHKELVFAFMRQKLAPFENNPDLIKNADVFDSNIMQEWKDFQEKFQQDKENAIKNFDYDNSSVFNKNFLDVQQRIQKNLEALEKVKPEDLTAADIYVGLGTAWIPPSDIEQFLRETFDIYSSNLSVKYAEITSAWEIEGKKTAYGNAKAEVTYGVEDCVNALVIIENILNVLKWLVDYGS